MNTCIQCGQTFHVPPSSAGLYCSIGCMYKHRVGENSPTWKGGLLTLACLVCGKEVKVKPSHAKKGAGKTCSVECRTIWHAQHLKGRGSTLVTKPCEACGAEMKVRPSRLERTRYCSKVCMAKGYQASQAGDTNPNWKGGPVIQVCEQCGAGYEASQSQLNSIGRRFCSVSCGATWRMLNDETKGRSHGGKRADLGNKYFRSSWEANYARYLNWLISLGEIISWGYETKTFTFPGITRGNMTYIIDFEVTNTDRSIEYHEVKGYMDDDSAVKLRRMAKYFPDVKLVLIDKDAYKAIERQVRNIIPHWEVARKRSGV